MALDPTIPLGAQPPQQPDYLGQFGKYAAVSNAVAQNKLLGIASQNQQQDLAQKQQNQAITSLNLVRQNLAALSDNPNTTAQDIAQRAALLESSGAVPKGFTDHVVGKMPTDPAAIPGFLAQARTDVEANLGRLQQQLYGAPTLVNNGQRQQWNTVNADPAMPGAGVRPMAGPSAVVQNQLTPEAATAPTQIGTVPTGPNAGAPIVGTRQQFIDAAGGGGSGGATPPATPGPTPSPLGTGRIPVALRNPAAGGATPGGGVVTGLGPGQQAALAAQGGQSAQAFSDIAQQGVAARNQQAVLGNMLGDTSQFVTGPGTQGLQQFQAVLNRVGLGGIIPADKLAAVDSFNKLAAQLADAQGAGSDARLSVTQHANPSAALTPQGVNLVLRQLQGNTDYQQARAQLASQWPNQGDRAGFEAQVGSKLDPRAFQFARLQPEQKATYAKALSPTDLKAVRGSYNWAVDNGLIGQ